MVCLLVQDGLVPLSGDVSGPYLKPEHVDFEMSSTSCFYISKLCAGPRQAGPGLHTGSLMYRLGDLGKDLNSPEPRCPYLQNRTSVKLSGGINEIMCIKSPAQP